MVLYNSKTTECSEFCTEEIGLISVHWHNVKRCCEVSKWKSTVVQWYCVLYCLGRSERDVQDLGRSAGCLSQWKT